MKRLPLIFLAVLIAVRLGIAIGHDDPLSHDELAHFSYVSYVNQFQEIPRFASSKHTVDMADDALKGFYWYENFQQPGFYVLASPFIVFGSKGVRLFSLSLWIGGVFLIWGVCRKWWTLLFLCLPGSILVSAMVTNQSLEFFGACMLAYGLHEESDWTVMVGAVLLCTARITGVAVCGGLLAWYMIKSNPRALYLAPGIGLGLWLFADRAQFFGVNSIEWQGVYSNIQNVGHAFVTGAVDPMWGVGQWMAPIGLLVIAVGTVLLWRNWRWFITSDRGIAVGVCTAILVWFGMTHGFSEGRLMYAAVPFMVVR